MSARLNPTRAVVSNGLVVTAKQTRKTPAVAINLALRAGAIVDPGDAAGASVLLSRVLDRGTTGKSSTEVADALENRGASLSLSVTRQLLSLTSTCLSEDVEDIFALLADIVRHPVVPETDLVTRKAQVLTSLQQDADNPAGRSVDAVMAGLYGDTHPYGRPITGTAASVAPPARHGANDEQVAA